MSVALYYGVCKCTTVYVSLVWIILCQGPVYHLLLFLFAFVVSTSAPFSLFSLCHCISAQHGPYSTAQPTHTCIIACCTVACCTIACCTLHYHMLHRHRCMLHYRMLHYHMLHYRMLHYLMLHHCMLHYRMLHRHRCMLHMY